MTKRVSLVMVLVMIAQLLLGCVKADAVFRVNQDDSSTLIVTIGIRKDAMGDLEDFRKEAIAEGARVTPWEDDKYKGYRAVYEFENPDQLARYSGTVLSIRREGSLLYVTIIVEAEEPDITVGIDASISIIVPGRVISYTEPNIAEQVAENQVTWWPDLEVTRTYELTVVAEVGAEMTPMPVEAERITIQPPLTYRGHTYTVEYQAAGDYRRSDANLFFVAAPEFFEQHQILGLAVYRDGELVTDEEELRTVFTLYTAAYLLYEHLPANALSSLPPGFEDDLKKAMSSPSFVAQRLTAILKDRRGEIAQALRAMLTPQIEPVQTDEWLGYVKSGVETGKGIPEAIDAALEAGQWMTSSEIRRAAIGLRQWTADWRPLTVAGDKVIDVGARRLQWDTALNFLSIALQVLQAAELEADRAGWLETYQAAFQSGQAALDADQVQAIAQVQKEIGNIAQQRLDILSQALRDKTLDLGAKITVKTLASKLTSWSINRYGLQHVAPYLIGKVAVFYGTALTLGDLLFGLSNVYDNLRLAQRAYELYQRFQAGRIALQEQAKAQTDRATYDGELAERFRAAYMLEMLAAAQAHRSYADGAKNAGVFGLFWAEAANQIRELAARDEQIAEAYAGHPSYVDTAVDLALHPVTTTQRPDTDMQSGETVFTTPEEAITHYLEGVAQADIHKILQACAINETGERFRFDLHAERLGRINPLIELSPSDYPFYVELNKLGQSSRILGQVRALVYSLLSDEEINGRPVEMDAERVSKFIRDVDPSRLVQLRLLKIGIPEPELMRSDRHRENQARFAAVYGADETTERVALFSFGQDYYVVGFTLLRYGENWKIINQISVLGNTGAYGTARKTTLAEFNEMIR